VTYEAIFEGGMMFKIGVLTPAYWLTGEVEENSAFLGWLNNKDKTRLICTMSRDFSRPQHRHARHRRWPGHIRQKSGGSH